MSSRTFEYPLLPSNGKCMPFIPLFLYNPIQNKGLPIAGLLDTGADSCVFPSVIATNTGHNLKADGVVKSLSRGVDDTTVTTWRHTFEIWLLRPDRQNIAWKSSPTLISCVDHNNIPPLLGYNDFLSNFCITFDYLKNKVIIFIPQ